MKKSLYLLIANTPDGGDSKTPASPTPSKPKSATEPAPGTDTVAPGSNISADDFTAMAESPEQIIARQNARIAELEKAEAQRTALDAQTEADEKIIKGKMEAGVSRPQAIAVIRRQKEFDQAKAKLQAEIRAFISDALPTATETELRLAIRQHFPMANSEDTRIVLRERFDVWGRRKAQS